MLLSDFHITIPTELIAQEPLAQRDQSRLLVCRRGALSCEATTFRQLPNYVQAGDLLVFNDTRVIPARLQGKKTTGGAVEVFLLEKRAAGTWQVLVRGKHIRVGTLLHFGEQGEVRGEVTADEGQTKVVHFDADDAQLLQCGSIPLPPYIRRAANQHDQERYQSLFARHEGAVAAPTASLHFTPEIMERMQARGIRVAFTTLHVGLGTFLPIKVENIREHTMHAEYYDVPAATIDAIREVKAQGGRVIAVGTTVVRALESCFAVPDRLAPNGRTEIFIYPGYHFRVVDQMITNFHLPDSTLILLVSAFHGKEHIKRAYEYAVAQRFRFFSYGDAMAIL
ncbi:tRNA preQ1(34) S-adenosylmethionine ribosyltransferase-isomerase QueA [Chrysiogenes arsenatis]|uniref:tRNA preQ1(34) S-adenosylmethionine ribosyltransferase-isomerase QueA n=1 Tax=Chrysiogenes arsenatis TaxID=309797 RepID=UPI00041B59D5|nr:tRNA preQ1(34) S-adenosylmethionine ribosyltransferase-isomerase QueA [Chrysiogenes arsenatis]